MSEGLELTAKVNGLTSGILFTKKQLQNGEAERCARLWLDVTLADARRRVTT